MHRACAFSELLALAFIIISNLRTSSATPPPDPYLLITTNAGIQRASLKTQHSHFLYNSNTLPVAIDFHLKGNTTTVFWSDITLDRISAAEVVNDRLENVRTVVSGGLDSVEGLAVDWLACNLYWIESKYQEIEVAHCDGSLRTSVVGDVQRARSLALDPRVGFLFWTDWDAENPRIERSHMDGSGRSGSIHTIRYDGSDHRKVLDIARFSHPFSVDVFSDYFYWTDITYSSIFKANRFTPNASQEEVLHSSIPFYQAAIVDSSRHPTSNAKNVCAHNNGHCSHLCVSDASFPRCLCPYGFELSSNKRTCEAHGQLLVFITKETPTAHFVFAMDPTRWAYPALKINGSVLSAAFDAVHDVLYWIDGRSVKRHRLKDGVSEAFAEFGPRVKLTALALDSLSRNIYLGSSVQLNSDIRNHISVCSVGDCVCSNLIWDKVKHVAGIAVDPVERLVFWMERDRAKSEHDSLTVKVASLDGSNQRMLLSRTVFKTMATKGLSANPHKREVCWGDLSNSSVSCTKYYSPLLVQEYAVPEDTSGGMEFTSSGEELVYSVASGAVYSLSSQGVPNILFNATQSLIYIKHTGIDTYSEKTVSSHPCRTLATLCHGICIPQNSNYTCVPFGGSHALLIFLQNHRPVAYAVGSDTSAPPLLLQATLSEMMIDVIHTIAEEEVLVSARHDQVFQSRIDGYNMTLVASTPGWRVTALAVDVSQRLLYKGVYGPTGARIEVSDWNNAAECEVLSSNLFKILSLAVHPSRKLLFWSDAGQWSRIERMDLDKGTRDVVVKDEVIRVSDIVLDIENDLLYWCDQGTARIERARLDGSRRTDVLLNKGPNRHYSPVSVAILNSVLFWIDSTYSGGSLVAMFKNRHPQISTWSRYLGPNVSHLQLYDRRTYQRSNETTGIQRTGPSSMNLCRAYCFNGGTCSVDVNTASAPTCQCQSNFTGPRCQYYATYFYDSSFTDEEAVDMRVVWIPLALLVVLLLLLFLAAWVKRRRSLQSSMCSLSSEEANPALTSPMVDCQYETSFSDNVSLMGTNPAFGSTISNA
ncbi:prolow-density lipoprotein receptor-related protein 1-like isoform X2 [Ornithodoros turicata]|uniref:prolow-density lipoprotein receptor-related protein 1-like isoform X2 n=1 Tax=Ornithodoros turicata TaxID=34597 RepID=UPI003138651B